MGLVRSSVVSQSIVIAKGQFGSGEEIFSSLWWKPLALTLNLMAVSVVIAAIFGILGAWAASNIAGRGRMGAWIARGFLAAMVAAIALPMVLHAAAWESTAGKFGWVPLTQTGSRSSALGAFGAFGGLTASGWIHGMIGTAMVSLATWYGVGRVPASILGQSALEMGPMSEWWRVRLPLALPWLTAALLATAALAASEMTVVDLYGYRTVADEFYLFHTMGTSISAVGIALVLPLGIASIAILLVPMWRRRMTSIHGETGGRHHYQRCDRRWYLVACAAAVVVALMVIVVPLAGLVVKAGHQVTVEDSQRTSSWSAGRAVENLGWAPLTFADEYRWTAMIAVLSGLTAVVVSFPLAAVGRTHVRLGRVLDAVSLVLVLIPGPIVGMVMVRVFQWEIPGFRSAYQQTLVPTILALLVRSGTVAYWILRSGYRGIEDRVLDASRLDLSWWARIWSVDRPLLGRSLCAAFLGSAIVASGDVPAMLLVIPPGVTTVGTRLFELLHNGARYQEAALALWYVGIVVALVAVWLKWGIRSRAKLE